MKKRKKIVSRIAAGVLFATVIIVTVALFISKRDGRNYRKHMELAQRYIEELQYGQAIAEYKSAIEIEPNNAETYQALAELYVLMEDYESAAEILSRGIEQTGEEELSVQIEKVQAVHGEQPEFAHTHQEETGRGETQGSWGDAEKNLEREEVEYLEDGTCVVHEYDADGTLVKEHFFDAKGFEYFRVYDYDMDGNCEKCTEYFCGFVGTEEYDADGLEKVFYTLYEYDENGNCVKNTLYDADGVVSSYTLHEYDENGNCVKDTLYDADGAVSSYTLYEYDENDHCLKESKYGSNGKLSRVCEYDENGNDVKISLYDGYSGRLSIVDEYVYDANGKQVITIWYKADEVVQCYQISEYDTDGKFVKSTRYHADGSIDYVYYADGSIEYTSE